MWLFPWNPNSDSFSGYEIGEQVTSFAGKSIWSLFKAKKKATNESLSIFRFDKAPDSSNSVILEQAKQSLKRIKTLRHPSILKYVDSIETEKSICIVTEAIIPLADYLNDASEKFTTAQKEFSIAYGLVNVAKGVQFMNNDCQLNHNNINIRSIFVTASGVWKIGGLEYVCPLEELPPSRTDELAEKYTPPERLDPSKARHPGGKFAVDSWGMGCLVWECFNSPLTPNGSVKTVGKMPKPLSIHYNKLVQSSPRHRVSPMDFIDSCKSANVFFNTPLIETILYLEEIQLVKEPSEKAKFFTRLEGELESFPTDLCKNKILPDLINAFEYGEAGSSILNPIFRIGKMLSEEDYQAKLVPCIIKLFACKDRATRSKLLQQLDSYIHFIAQNVINELIFPQVVQGFLDSSFIIREQTVKSMLHLAPKLNSTNLNEELMKHFGRLITRDEEGGIRANTTVCLGKIAKHLSSTAQVTILLPTLLRVLRDPFPPARHAAIAGLSANESLFETKDCATKIMPSLCPLCVDPDQNVRRLAFKSLKLFTGKLECVSEKETSSPPQPTSSSTASSPDKTRSTGGHSPTNSNSERGDQTTATAQVATTAKLKSMSLKDK